MDTFVSGAQQGSGKKKKSSSTSTRAAICDGAADDTKADEKSKAVKAVANGLRQVNKIISKIAIANKSMKITELTKGLKDALKTTSSEAELLRKTMLRLSAAPKNATEVANETKK
eukprot:2137791-Lingulodinium_polyedra.AAC.1